MFKTRRSTHIAWLTSLVIAPVLLTDCGSDGPLSLGDGTAGYSAGSSNAGSANGSNAGAANGSNAGAANGSNAGSANGSNAGSANGSNAGSANGSNAGSANGSNAGAANGSNGGSSGRGGGSGGAATCAAADCGPVLGLLNYECPDGSMAGPTGRCLEHDDGTCGWEIRSCPSGSGGSGGASAGSGGQAGQLCGGSVCGTDEVCCGPTSCGHCINKASGAYCPPLCPGGSGGTSSGGASGGASADCSTQLANVQATLATAQACNTASAKPELECAGTLEGVCCPVLVETSASSDSANSAYLNALHTYKQNCTYACPATLCAKPQTGSCVAAQGSPLGTCGGGSGF